MGIVENLRSVCQKPEHPDYRSVYERTIVHLEGEASNAGMVIPEGPPIYLWPDAKYPSQRWDNKGFELGWSMVNDLTARISSNVHHFFLVDEFNNRPVDFDEGWENHILNQIAYVSPAFSRTSLLQQDNHPRNVARFRESDFLKAGEPNGCSNLDAAFQFQKLLFFAERYPDFTLEHLQRLKLYMIHPVGFQQQQGLMLCALLGEMKRPPFDRLSKKQRRDVISSIYRHVWIDEDGEIESVTFPVWDGNKFVFEKSLI